MVSPTEKTDISSHTRELFVCRRNGKIRGVIVLTFLQESLSLKPAPQTNRRPSDDRTAASRTRPPRERPSERSATSKGKDPLDIFADPPSKSASTRAPPRRPRRNSESSVMDRGSKLLDVDDSEKRRRERRNREREGRSKDTKDGKSRSGRKDRRLDIIDKLDVTSIYGTGSKYRGVLLLYLIR